MTADPIEPPLPADPPEVRWRWLRRSLMASCGVLVVLGGAGFAALRYDSAHASQFLPGVVIGDVPAAGMRGPAVVERLEAGLPALKARAITVTAGDREAKVTMAQMGLRSDAREAVARARDTAEGMGVGRRVWHRLLDKPVNRTYPVQLLVQDAAREALTPLAEEVKVNPVDAKIDTSSGFVTIRPAVEGRSLDLDATAKRVYEMADRLAKGGIAPQSLGQIEAPIVVVKPEVTDYPDVILVRTGENKLYHYQNGSLAKTYNVATGARAFPTPKGMFSIVEKRRNPTWVNPDPRGWGKSLPARIGPGPSNPLGTRALNVSAPGIRIHGTKNTASLGTAASHGCIRMSINDSEELFELVDKGTPVAIIQGPAPAPKADVAVSTIGDPGAPIDLDAG